MERARRGRGVGGPPRGRATGGRGRGRGQEGWESVDEGRSRNMASLETTQDVVPSQPFTAGTLAKRPDNGGRVGRPIEVFANFFMLNCGLERAFHFDVNIKQGGERRRLGEGDEAPTGQQILPMRLCRAIIDACASQNNWPTTWVFDGKKNIYSPTELFPKPTSFPVDLSGDSGRERLFEVEVKPVAVVNVLDLQRFLSQGDISPPRDVVQLLEICLRFAASNNPRCYLSGRSIYYDDPSVNFQLPGGGELFMGYHQGVKLCQKGLALNVETTCTAFLKSRPVLELFSEVLRSRITEDFELKAWMHKDLSKCISNVMVTTLHRPSSKKHRCLGLTERSAAATMFELKSGQSLSVAEYWQQQYGPLRFPHLPCLNLTKGKKVNFLPPEVCQVAPRQRQDRLTEDQTRETIKFSAKKPEERKYSIQAMLRKANIASDATSEKFKLSIKHEMIRTNGRILPQPHLQYQRPESMDTGIRGAWNLDGVKFFRPAVLKSWAIVNCMDKQRALQRGEQGLPVFIDSMMRMFNEMGMSLPAEKPPLVHKAQYTVKESLEIAMAEGLGLFKRPVDFILVLLVRKESHPYQEFKRVAEGVLGVVTQCIVARSAGIGSPPKGRMQYLANVAMKVNQKLGGINTQITGSLGSAFPVLSQHGNRPFIVFGADVTHPTSFDRNEPSVGALVASMDPFLGQFAAKVFSMAHREEKMTMKDSIKDLFIKFYQANNLKPEAVFIYRDGISEGQFQEVFEHEYGQFQQAFAALEDGYRPPITMVLVQKRHHTRLFPASAQAGDHKGNVVPGTIVDTNIISRYDFDFYLNSHSGIQGTNRPAHYYVLLDENGFGSDGIQLFSYWLCYLYCRCTRSVSYAPPAYYAHLAALHGRYLVSGGSDSSSEGSNNGASSLFKDELGNRMFFI